MPVLRFISTSEAMTQNRNLGLNGEPRWGRTNDHLIKSQVLYRLS